MYSFATRSYLAGYCKYCGAPGYWNSEEQKITFQHPELGCLCYIDEYEEDMSASQYNFRGK